jgi:hypothetical protein
VGRKASSKVIESAGLVQLSGVRAATNRQFETPFARSRRTRRRHRSLGYQINQERRIRKVISMPSQNDNGGRRGPWGGGAKPGSDLGDPVRQGQDRVQQIKKRETQMVTGDLSIDAYLLG